MEYACAETEEALVVMLFIRYSGPEAGKVRG